MSPWALSLPTGGFAQKPHDFSRGGVFTYSSPPCWGKGDYPAGRSLLFLPLKRKPGPNQVLTVGLSLGYPVPGYGQSNRPARHIPGEDSSMADKVQVRPYLSPTLVLLAFDWAEGRGRNDFLGFAIRRTPGFGRQSQSWLPNRLSFDGPADMNHPDLPSNENPIQKFMWWDARIDSKDRGKNFEYTVTPVVGAPASLQLLDDAAATIPVEVPREVEQGIGTYFNSEVVSSQAFTREFTDNPTGKVLDKALSWLANGLDAVIPEFIKNSPALDGAIYHLTDTHWVIPALEAFDGPASIVYHAHPNDKANDQATADLGAKPNFSFAPRSHTNIMHNKFLVRVSGGVPTALLTGSANFTTEGLTSQANLLHTWDSPDLAALFQSRQELIAENPSLKATTSAQNGWSDPVTVGDASVSVFFSPEPEDERVGLGRIVDAVKAARKSVIFCLFDPTDQELRDECFNAADRGLMMFGLVNSINAPKAGGKTTAATTAAVDIFHRSRDQKDVFSHAAFRKGKQPKGFWWEISSVKSQVDRVSGAGDEVEDNKRQPPEVYIHHKFIVLDAETDNPIVYSGSANMSNNSSHKNDENLLEITGSPRLARIYLAEFLRLYEHYRALRSLQPPLDRRRLTEVAEPDILVGREVLQDRHPGVSLADQHGLGLTATPPPTPAP